MMDERDKQEFINALLEVGKIYDQNKTDILNKSKIYWATLSHRTIADVKSALNAHLRDPDRGKFFPKPADVEYQLPKNDDLWLDAEEAWAMCPKDEYGSYAVCDEMMKAYGIARDLINAGDMIGARMSFKSAYNRLVSEAKQQNRVPKWFASYGMDKDGRFEAEVKTVELNNLALPMEERKALPVRPDEPIKSLDQLMLMAPVSVSNSTVVKRNIARLRSITGGSHAPRETGQEQETETSTSSVEAQEKTFDERDN